MGVKVIFNPDTRIIEVKTGVTELDVKVDLYSDGKEDWLSTPSLNMIEFPFIPVGGNIIKSGQVSPAYFFLKYPWKIQTHGDGNILSVALNLYGLAENGIDTRTQNDTYIVIAGDGLSVTNSDLPGFDSEMNNAIQQASFNGGITVDVVNGVPGTAYPIGNSANPVDNFVDAVSIDSTRAFKKLFVVGDATITTGDDISNMEVHGQSSIQSLITVDSGAVVDNCIFRCCKLTGTLDDGASVCDCMIQDLSYFEGYIRDSVIMGTLTLGGSNTTYLINCSDGNPGTTNMIVDMGSSGRDLMVTDHSGGITLKNLTGANTAVLNVDVGRIEIESTVIAGEVWCRGIGTLVDNSGVGATIIDNVLTQQCIADSVWDETLADHLAVGSTGKALDDAGAAGNPWSTLVSGNTTPGTFGEAVYKIKKWGLLAERLIIDLFK